VFLVSHGSLHLQSAGRPQAFLKFVAEHDFDIVHVHKPRAMRFALQSFAPDIARPAIVAQRGNCYRVDDYTRGLLNDRRVKAVRLRRRGGAPGGH
jgi:hypothetical protein